MVPDFKKMTLPYIFEEYLSCTWGVTKVYGKWDNKEYTF